MLDSPSPGEAGGVFAGIVAAIIALGHGLKWWLGWTDRRAAGRSAKLDAWQNELRDRERRFDERQDEYQHRIEAELEKVRSEHATLFACYQLIATALRVIDPANATLQRADDLLRATFSSESALPASFTAIARKLDQID